MNEKRVRKLKQEFYITEEESALIIQKMQAADIKNKSEFFRKMVLGGYIVKQDFSVLRELLTELSRIGNNVNQIARVANTFGVDEIREDDLKRIQKELNKICRQLTLTT